MSGLSRRAVLEFAPSVAALIVAEIGLAPEAAAQRPPQDTPQRISKEQLKNALDVMGLEFTEAERDMMLGGVNRALGGFETVRKMDIPLDTEPAFHFRPALPGKEPKPRASKFTPTRVSKPASFKNVEELALWP